MVVIYRQTEWFKKEKAVGVIAAQSIGEPGTQLTLRTFHVGVFKHLNLKFSKIQWYFGN